MRFEFGEFQLDDKRYTLAGPAGPVHVEPQVFELLRHLIANRERVVSKEELLDWIWGDWFVSESALTSRVKAARRAIGDDGQAQRVIKTVHARGYHFVAEVRTDAGRTEHALPRYVLYRAVHDRLLREQLDAEAMTNAMGRGRARTASAALAEYGIVRPIGSHVVAETIRLIPRQR